MALIGAPGHFGAEMKAGCAAEDFFQSKIARWSMSFGSPRR